LTFEHFESSSRKFLPKDRYLHFQKVGRLCCVAGRETSTTFPTSFAWETEKKLLCGKQKKMFSYSMLVAAEENEDGEYNLETTEKKPRNSFMDTKLCINAMEIHLMSFNVKEVKATTKQKRNLMNILQGLRFGGKLLRE